jgi:transposase-like protein
MNAKALSDIRRKRRILDYGKQIHNVSKACGHFGVSSKTYYKWKRDYEQEGKSTRQFQTLSPASKDQGAGAC